MTGKPLVSSCCGAPMRVESGDDGDIGNKDSVTNHYVCTACGKPATPEAEEESRFNYESSSMVPQEIHDAAIKVGNWFKLNWIKGWVFYDLMDRWNRRPAPTVEQVEKAVEALKYIRGVALHRQESAIGFKEIADRAEAALALLPLLTGKKGEK